MLLNAFRWGFLKLLVSGKWCLELDSAELVIDGTVDGNVSLSCSLIGGPTIKFPHMVHFSSAETTDWMNCH